MKNILTLFLFSFSITLFAQDTTQAVTNTIYWKWPLYRMNGKPIKAMQLNNELNKYPESALYLKKAKKNITVGVLSYIPLGVSLFLIKKPYTPSYKPGVNTPFYIGTTLSAAVLLYSMIRYKSFMKKAILIQNEKRAIVY